MKPMEKRGNITPESRSDFNPKVKAKYAEAEGFAIAGEEDKDQLKDPVPLFSSPPPIRNVRTSRPSARVF